MKRLIEARNLTPRRTVWNDRSGQEPTNSQGTYNADIMPGHSIRIFGVMTNHVGGPREFDRVFKIGDEAVYGSYNLIYTGRIVKIGPKTVTIKHYEHTSDVTQLQTFCFVDKNWNFNAERIAHHNAEESQCL